MPNDPIQNPDSKLPWDYPETQPEPSSEAPASAAPAEPSADTAVQPAPAAPETPEVQTFPAPQTAVKKKKGMTAGKIVALALCCAIIGSIAGGTLTAGLFILMGWNSGPGVAHLLEGDRASSVIDITKVDTSKLMTAAEVYATNVKSTVGIIASYTINSWGQQTTSTAAGSGFILSDNGYILTNFHVIENADSITVIMYDNTEYEATLIGYDINNDIAVLKIHATGLVPVVLGDSANANVGDQVIAIGNPLGELTFSLTAGNISALDRQVTIASSVMSLIQTDCAINSGNSGGALFNMYGEVIGITNAKYSGTSSSGASIDNIAFAIPINRIRSIVESLIETGLITKPYIGVSVSDVSKESQNFGAPKGAAVLSVTAGGPAAQGGLKINDIITKVNDTDIRSSADLVTFIGDTQIGQVLTVTVYRQRNYQTIQITVGQTTQPAIPE